MENELTKQEQVLRDKLDEFAILITKSIDQDFFEFIRDSSIDDLIYCQLMCKDGSVVDAPRVLSFLNQEITRRSNAKTNRRVALALIISGLALLLSIYEKWCVLFS